MIKIKNSVLATSAVHPHQYPEEILPNIVLFGRSNAGKSSLINTLINRKNLARTSSAPGKTRLLNFYRISGVTADEIALNWYFVDMPGYGYAKVSKSERDGWLKMMENYLRSENSKFCWQLVDIRHQPSREDILMHNILRDNGYDVLVIANKTDKISKNARAASLKKIAESLDIDKKKIVCFSAVSKDGREDLLAALEAFLLKQQAPVLAEQADS